MMSMQIHKISNKKAKCETTQEMLDLDLENAWIFRI